MPYVTPGYVIGEVVLCRSGKHNVARPNGMYLSPSSGSRECAGCHKEKIARDKRTRARRTSKALELLRKLDSGRYQLIEV